MTLFFAASLSEVSQLASGNLVLCQRTLSRTRQRRVIRYKAFHPSHPRLAPTAQVFA